LHFAPEFCLRQRLQNLPQLEYVTGDLDPQEGDLQVDITAMTFADRSVDAIICSHVLEHVENDRQAMRELFRVLRPGGWALVLVPLAPERSTTFEDARIVAPQQRVIAFGQHDHVRLYALDIVDRLSAAGFSVRSEHLGELFAPTLLEQHGLTDEIFFRCTRPVAHSGSA
jgi:predicted SAM-dependent methyltransferase